jgi:hypothetical protein
MRLVLQRSLSNQTCRRGDGNPGGSPTDCGVRLPRAWLFGGPQLFWQFGSTRRFRWFWDTLERWRFAFSNPAQSSRIPLLVSIFLVLFIEALIDKKRLNGHLHTVAYK